MRRAIVAAVFLCACEAERPVTGIVHDPSERARALAEIQNELQAKRDREAKERAAEEARRAEEDRRAEEARAKAEEEHLQAEAAQRAEETRKARCESEKQQRAAALAGLDAEVAKVKEAGLRHQKAEKWIAAHCRTLAHKDTAVELYTDAKGRVRRREVVTGTSDPFQACPAKTPDDIAEAGGLTYDDDTGWTRTSAPPKPRDPEDFRSVRLIQINKALPHCKAGEDE